MLSGKDSLIPKPFQPLAQQATTYLAFQQLSTIQVPSSKGLLARERTKLCSLIATEPEHQHRFPGLHRCQRKEGLARVKCEAQVFRTAGCSLDENIEVNKR